MDTSFAEIPQTTVAPVDKEKVLPLPSWLVKVYFIFPVVLYIPDAIFNYYVYSDGWDTSGTPLLQVGKVALVSFLSIGVVGMAYLLSVLAPWHWGQGHHVQAFFCALGVIIATAITTWNSLAYRSGSFVEFKTDQWAYNLWPQLQTQHVSITMILVSIAPPFWGLFWALVQPTETGRSLRQLQESHAERLLRVQHEAEVKRMKAEANAKVREAQLRSMARTAATARDQAAEVLRRKQEKKSEEQPAVVATDATTVIPDEVRPDESMTQPTSLDDLEEVLNEAFIERDPLDRPSEGSTIRPLFPEGEPKAPRSGSRKSPKSTTSGSRTSSGGDSGGDSGRSGGGRGRGRDAANDSDNPESSDVRRARSQSAAAERMAALGGTH